jgi:hypothetical protein
MVPEDAVQRAGAHPKSTNSGLIVAIAQIHRAKWTKTTLLSYIVL